ncbi:MAG: hypothetical protein ACYDEE_11880 [Ignavibacteriaceae bacterium]
MLELIIIYGIISFASDIILLTMVKNAPDGWEDESGFHLGKEPDTDVENIMVSTIKAG